ncbi:response regulator [Mitsuaria sp. WAJ17]|uniref:response regulator n=1 Tax=Mitsuaria sp. WAJ17 TaxID=2761452 RepID=UPI00160164E7|nr:response regulator [Mitsuaria sp. WAJ17]MBB2487050.1 response regulator [Mitsuaria sp. WAJ17]
MKTLRRILCVEDDPDIRELIGFSLRDVGDFEVLLCEDADAALAQVEAFAPDFVLLDVMMPGMSGPELLAVLRTLPFMQGVPVVFMTAKAMPFEVEELLHHQSTGVIVKPFDPLTLPDHLRMYWEHGRDGA